MTAESVRDRLHERPFQPFWLRMPEGRLLRVPHPEFISIEPEQERIAVRSKGQGRYGTVDLELVSDLEPWQEGTDGMVSRRSVKGKELCHSI